MPLWQSSKAAPSSEHSKVSSAGAVRLSVPLKTNIAEVRSWSPLGRRRARSPCLGRDRVGRVDLPLELGRRILERDVR